MNTEQLHLAIMSGNDWGNRLSENDSFYRLLFKLDKKRDNETEKLTNEEVNWLFASYKKWFTKTQAMLEDCFEDNQGNQEAQKYGEQLKFDILDHVHQILNECKLESEELRGKLQVQADIEKQRLLRIEQEKIDNEKKNMEL